MPGNESAVIKFLLENLGNCDLPHIGKLTHIGNPGSNGGIETVFDASQVHSDNANKKADIYLNNRGISIKQSGANFSFNRIQRKFLPKFFETINLSRPALYTFKLDNLVHEFHNGNLQSRNQPWDLVFNQSDFFRLLRYLMLTGSPKGVSPHPAELILSAPAILSSVEQMALQTFEEYFESNRDHISLSIRRQWVGQSSDSEHKRATGIATDMGNNPWVFHKVVGEPNSGWRQDWPVEDRKTVYFLMLEERS